jgi:hypothetical protein
MNLSRMNSDAVEAATKRSRELGDALLRRE